MLVPVKKFILQPYGFARDIAVMPGFVRVSAFFFRFGLFGEGQAEPIFPRVFAQPNKRRNIYVRRIYRIKIHRRTQMMLGFARPGYISAGFPVVPGQVLLL